MIAATIRVVANLSGAQFVTESKAAENLPDNYWKENINVNSTLIWVVAITATVMLAAMMIMRKKMPVGPPIPDALRKGNALPEFSAIDEDGNKVSASDLRGKPAVILFVRGNWCPFCNRQVEGLTARYREIIELGAALIFVTPKPLGTTRRVAEFFKVEFDYWLDDSVAAAKSLGLVLSGGVPADHAEEYGEDTVWPTTLIVDKDGIIQYSKLARYIFDRPNPDRLLKELKKL